MRFMRPFSKYSLAIAALSFMALPAKADLLLEPYLGFGAGTAKNTPFGVSGSYSDTMAGTTVGGRVGYAMPLLWFAADYSLSNGSFKNSEKPSGASSVDGDYSGSNLYAVVGVKVPLLQAYAGYGLMNELTLKKGVDEKFSGGTNFKLGAGFTGLPFIALNLELLLNKYGKFKGAGGESDINSGSTAVTDAQSTTWMITVSAPFRL
jgi:hypothetical protein